MRMSSPLPFILDFINDAGADLPDEDVVRGSRLLLQVLLLQVLLLLLVLLQVLLLLLVLLPVLVLLLVLLVLLLLPLVLLLLLLILLFFLHLLKQGMKCHEHQRVHPDAP